MKAIMRILAVWVCTSWVAPALALGAGGLTDFASGPDKIVHFKLSGPLLERPLDEVFLFAGERPLSLNELIRRMKKARDDDAVKAVVLTFETPALGLGQLEELRQAIEQIKAVDKDVYVHSEDYLSTRLYCLACAASHLSVVPTGDLWLIGLYGETPYLRGLLDKIGVQPDFMALEDYKTAAEILTRTGPSEAAQEQINWLVDDVFNSLASMMAESRGLSSEKMRKLIDHGLFTAEEARQAGLVDSVMHHQEFVAALRERYGQEVKIVRRYGQERGPQFEMNNILDVMNFLSELFSPAKKAAKDAVAVVYVDGPIVTGSEEVSPFAVSRNAHSTTIRKALDKALREDSIKAVILRVDSPGGSALASEIIWDAGQRVKAKKPFVVSMGNVAGSGGYYVSCGADMIFADATTITASIGVVGGKLVTTEMWDKLGVSWHPTQRGENAALLNTSRPFSDKERKKIMDWMEGIYTVFKGHVTAGRGDKLAKPIDEIAGGRVFTGKQALELGLVDKLGTLDDAIKYAAAQARISEYDIRVLPEPKTIFDMLMEGFGRGEEEEEVAFDRGAARPSRLLGKDSLLMRVVLPVLTELDPLRAEALRTALTRLQLIHDEGAVTMMPFDIVFR